MRSNEEVCGTCKWCKFDRNAEDFICTNPDSNNIADYVEYKDFCYEWESKESEETKF